MTAFEIPCWLIYDGGMFLKSSFFIFFYLSSTWSSAAQGTEESPFEVVKSFDGFPMNMVLELPQGVGADDVKRIIVFAHGSGPQNADGDLSSVSFPAGTENLIYKDIARAIRVEGFATLRFNKRSFQVRETIGKNPNYMNSKEFKLFAKNPLGHFIKDLKFFVQEARRRFKKAKVFILGHSQGTSLALYVGSELSFISGAALMGFSNEKVPTLVYEQTVHRAYRTYFRALDLNHDLVIDKAELSTGDDLATALKAQLKILDLDQDSSVSLSEYNAGNYSNLMLMDAFYDKGMMMEEVSRSRPSKLVKDANYKILFLQGELDNQTPAFHTKAVQIVNTNVWKKENLRFVYFPSAGHALDPKEEYGDLLFRKIPSATLKRIANELDEFFD
jgi:pimeloyl-ACP methyl ester carboxylesterase